MKAITVKPPWSWAIADGAKLVENRGTNFHYRGRLLIHSGRSWCPIGGADILIRTLFSPWLDQWTEPSGRFPFGAVIAVADLVDVHVAEGPCGGPTCCAPWGQPLHNGLRARHLVLANVVRLVEPVSCRGALGLWTPSPEVVDAVHGQIAEAVRHA